MKLCLSKEQYSDVGLPEFYHNVAEAAGLVLSATGKYDCTKIEVSADIQDAIFKYYSNKGYSFTDVAMAWLSSGPKQINELMDGEVNIEDGFVS